MDDLVRFYKGYLQLINKSSHTIKQYGIDSRQFLQFMKDHQHTFNEPLDKTINSYNEYLDEAYSNAASINRKRASLHHFLSFLKLRNIITDLPEGLLKPKIIEKPSIQTLTNQQVRMVSNYWFEKYKAAEDPEYKWIALRNFCLVNIILEIGVKPSEIVGMKWSHLNGNIITIMQGKKIRKLPLSMTILKWLDLFQYETEELLPLSKEGEFVWLGLGNKQNEPITVKTIERIFQTISKKLGFKVLATTLRYTLIDTEVKQLHSEQLDDIYKQYGYSRKSVLQERLSRLNKNP